jgi:hypothetical protein
VVAIWVVKAAPRARSLSRAREATRSRSREAVTAAWIVARVSTSGMLTVGSAEGATMGLQVGEARARKPGGEPRRRGSGGAAWSGPRPAMYGAPPWASSLLIAAGVVRPVVTVAVSSMATTAGGGTGVGRAGATSCRRGAGEAGRGRGGAQPCWPPEGVEKAGDGALAAGSRGRARTTGRRTLQGADGRGARLLGADVRDALHGTDGCGACCARRGRARALRCTAAVLAAVAQERREAGAGGAPGGKLAAGVVGRGAGGWGPAAAAGERRERSRRLGPTAAGERKPPAAVGQET